VLNAFICFFLARNTQNNDKQKMWCRKGTPTAKTTMPVKTRRRTKSAAKHRSAAKRKSNRFGGSTQGIQKRKRTLPPTPKRLLDRAAAIQAKAEEEEEEAQQWTLEEQISPKEMKRVKERGRRVRQEREIAKQDAMINDLKGMRALNRKAHAQSMTLRPAYDAYYGPALEEQTSTYADMHRDLDARGNAFDDLSKDTDALRQEFVDYDQDDGLVYYEAETRRSQRIKPKKKTTRGGRAGKKSRGKR
jgi:hypothetical protein